MSEFTIRNTAAEIKAAMQVEEEKEAARKQGRNLQERIAEETAAAIQRTGYHDSRFFDAEKLADVIGSDITAERIASAIVAQARELPLPELKAFIEKFGKEW